MYKCSKCKKQIEKNITQFTNIEYKEVYFEGKMIKQIKSIKKVCEACHGRTN